MLIEAAIGDAYGAGFEYVSDKIVNDFAASLQYRSHPRHKQIKPGMYTDDTQMSLAIAEAMLENDPWTTESLAERFVSVFKRDERTGYSKRLYSILKSVSNGTELLAKLHRDSNRSGAAMRGWLLGLYKDEQEIGDRVSVQSLVTHNIDGAIAAMAAAFTCHYFAYNLGPKEELGEYLNQECLFTTETGAWSEPYVGKVGAEGWRSVKAAITAVMRGNSMTEILKDCIAFTGDVDTVATIALGVASLSKEVKQDLSQHLYDGLENGPYGRDYIVGLDKQLYQRFLGK